jgi:hypothetical protein
LKPFPNFKVHHFFSKGFVDVFEPFSRVGLNVVATTNSTSSPEFHDASMSTTLVSVFLALLMLGKNVLLEKKLTLLPT